MNIDISRVESLINNRERTKHVHRDKFFLKPRKKKWGGPRKIWLTMMMMTTQDRACVYACAVITTKNKQIKYVSSLHLLFLLPLSHWKKVRNQTKNRCKNQIVFYHYHHYHYYYVFLSSPGAIYDEIKQLTKVSLEDRHTRTHTHTHKRLSLMNNFIYGYIYIINKKSLW